MHNQAIPVFARTKDRAKRMCEVKSCCQSDFYRLRSYALYTVLLVSTANWMVSLYNTQRFP